MCNELLEFIENPRESCEKYECWINNNNNKKITPCPLCEFITSSNSNCYVESNIIIAAYELLKQKKGKEYARAKYLSILIKKSGRTK